MVTTITIVSTATESPSAASFTQPTHTHEPFRGVPTFFRACCREASRGGKHSYEEAGHELARHCDNLHDEPEAVMGELLTLLNDAAKWYQRTDAAHQAVLAWFDREFPKCMALIPARRRDQFVRGVFRAYDDELVGV